MFKYLYIELKKLNYSKLPIFGLLLTILICIGVSIVELSNVDIGNVESFYVDFMLYNTTFVVMKVFVPVLILLLAASIWGGEYENGMIKSFLLCKVSKLEMFISKLLLLILSALFLVFIVFINFTIISIITNGYLSVSFEEILAMAKVYLLSAMGLLPLILITTIAAIYFGDFQKGFSLGIVVLFLSLSLDGLLKIVYLTPTYFISYCYLLHISTVNVVAYIVWGLYVILLSIIIFLVFKNKDIWQ